MVPIKGYSIDKRRRCVEPTIHLVSCGPCAVHCCCYFRDGCRVTQRFEVPKKHDQGAAPVKQAWPRVTPSGQKSTTLLSSAASHCVCLKAVVYGRDGVRLHSLLTFRESVVRSSSVTGVPVRLCPLVALHPAELPKLVTALPCCAECPCWSSLPL
ncbi:hypothetical protein RRG08_031816 [Elysia crispata]|uniref:Uncharacterized protein n=1 Tax=Elysia crispata TaxID=231223 RepID=A0AAE0Y5T9_9GAST|nr:hypothetical protein RRG08_031816 [Elysia crispata]